MEPWARTTTSTWSTIPLADSVSRALNWSWSRPKAPSTRQSTSSTFFPALPGHPEHRVLGGLQRGGQRGHHPDAAAPADSLPAHLLVHPDDGHADIPGHVLGAVGHLTHTAAQVEHGVHSRLSGLHVHANQPRRRSGGHIAGLPDICQDAGVLEAVELHIGPELFPDLPLHQLNELWGGCWYRSVRPSCSSSSLTKSSGRFSNVLC